MIERGKDVSQHRWYGLKNEKKRVMDMVNFVFK